MKTEYHEGPEALKNFEDGMKKLFQAPKPAKSILVIRFDSNVGVLSAQDQRATICRGVPLKV